MDLTTGIERIHRSSNNNPLETLQLRINHSIKELEMDYEPGTTRSFFDVCDPNGQVLHSQAIAASSTMRWSFANLPTGEYQLFVVDGDNMMRYQFTI